MNKINKSDLCALIFDMDGLLIDSELIYFEGFKRAVKITHSTIEENFFYSTIGKSGEFVEQIVSLELGGQVQAVKFMKVWRQQNEQLFSSPIPLKRGVAEVLQDISRVGISCAVATSTRTSFAIQRLSASGIIRHFRYVVGGEMVKRNKPAPDLYLKAATLLDVPPANCAAFEDSNNGVLSAIAAGMVVVHVPDLELASSHFSSDRYLMAATVLDGYRAIGLLR